MGVVAGAYGIQGWVKVAPWSEDPGALVSHGTWWVGGTERLIHSARQHGSHVIARLDGLVTPEQARALKGKLVCVPRAALPKLEDGRFYFADLVGMEVVNEQGCLLGVVKSMSSHGLQDVMEVVAAAGPVRMLPWVDVVIKRVDPDARRIEVDWGADW